MLLILINSDGLATNIFVSGDVSGNWDVDTVFVTSDLTLENLQSLEIEPGTKVIFEGHYIFKIKGQILAIGLENEKILFTVSDTTGFYNLHTGDGAWNGLWFDHLGPANDSSIFEHCSFEYAKAVGADSTYWYGGAVCIREFDRIRINDCSFNHNRAFKNGGAIYAKDADILVTDCHFENNHCGLEDLYGYGGALCLEYSDSKILRNTFQANTSTGVGGGLSFEYSDPLISHNEFYTNYSGLGGGLACLRSNGNQTVSNNLVANNNALFFGGGVAFIEASVLVVNNTIVENSTMSGGGIYMNFESFPVFKNCIVWDNWCNAEGPQVYIWDTYSAPEFYFCNVEGGVEAFSGTGGIPGGFIGVYEDCIDSDPAFINTTSYPFSLSLNSSCIDAGILDTTGLQVPTLDLAGKDRFVNGRIDIGAYEYQLTTCLLEIKNQKPEVNVFPNPSSGLVTIQCFAKKPGIVLCKIAQLSTGNIVLDNIVDVTQGINNIIPQTLSSGIYLGIVEDGNKEFRFKIVIK